MDSKVYKNKGVKRNKKPLKNIIYKVEVIQLKDPTDYERYEQYKFKDEGYLVLSYQYQNDRTTSSHGFITVEYLRELIGEKQYSKFCQGKREFIMQRRIDGANL